MLKNTKYKNKIVQWVMEYFKLRIIKKRVMTTKGWGEPLLSGITAVLVAS